MSVNRTSFRAKSIQHNQDTPDKHRPLPLVDVIIFHLKVYKLNRSRYRCQAKGFNRRLQALATNWRVHLKCQLKWNFVHTAFLWIALFSSVSCTASVFAFSGAPNIAVFQGMVFFQACDVQSTSLLHPPLKSPYFIVRLSQRSADWQLVGQEARGGQTEE